MKYKGIITLAFIGLIAAACNKSAPAQPSTNQDQSSSTTQPNTATNTAGNSSPDQSPPPTGTFSGETDVDIAPQPEVKEIKITSSGFSPAAITIKKGDYVQFTNTDSAPHWPASDPHPTHTGLPGFDAKKALTQGENYRFQFLKTGSFGFHDHLNSTWHGTVVVQ